jgi:membrane-associated phospholipid phosphatase
MTAAEGVLPAPILYQWGLDFIRAVQGAGNPAVTAVMKIITDLVSEFIFFAVVMILFWLADERKAFRFGVLVICSAWLNSLVKAFFRQPRPFHLEKALGMIGEGGYGFPSGHTQLILIFLVPLSAWLCLKKPALFRGRASPPGRLWKILIWAVTVLLITAVSFSRLYLGVHFPQDIAGGLLLGGLSLVLYFAAERRFSAPHNPKPSKDASLFRVLLEKPRYQLSLAAAAALLMNALVPRHSGGALLFGFTTGYILMRAHWPFSAVASGLGLPPRSAFLRAALFLAAGFAGAIILYGGLKRIFPGAASPYYGLFRFIRYGLSGFWVSGGAPRIFTAFDNRDRT